MGLNNREKAAAWDKPEHSLTEAEKAHIAMPKTAIGWGGDIGIGEQPDATALREQRAPTPDPALRRDYTDSLDDPADPDAYNWVMIGSRVIMSKDDTHEQMVGAHGYHNVEKPLAYGKALVHYRWSVDFQITHSNIALQYVFKALKKYAKDEGWQTRAFVDHNGHELGLPKTAAPLPEPSEWHVFVKKGAGSGSEERRVKKANDPGSGDRTVYKDWRRTDGDHNWGQDVEQSPYYGEQDPEDLSNIHRGLYECPECGNNFKDYKSFLGHQQEHVHKDQLHHPADPVIDYDQVMPADFNTLVSPGWLVQPNARVAKQPDFSPPGPIPFIYDIDKDRVYVGHPGETVDSIPEGGYNPLGVIEGIYKPDGQVEIRTQTNMPYTIRHLIQLWYYMHPELEVKGITMTYADGKSQKLAKADMNGIIVSAEPRENEAEMMAYPGGEPAHQLHTTLVAFDGEPEDIDRERLGQILAETAGDSNPIKARVGEMGTFPAGDEGDVPNIAHIDSPELHDLRQKLFDRLKSEGFPVSDKFPEFKPHITLAYTPEGEEIEHDVVGSPVSYDNLTLRSGSDVLDYPMGVHSLAHTSKQPGRRNKFYTDDEDQILRSLKQYGTLSQDPRDQRALREWLDEWEELRAEHERQSQDPKDEWHTSAVHPDWLNQYMETHGPYMYHAAYPGNLHHIMRHGLLPWDDETLNQEIGGGTKYSGDVLPRPNHSYVGREEAAGGFGPPYVRVDLRKLDPATISADEDHFMEGSAPSWFTGGTYKWDGIMNRGEWANLNGIGDRNPETAHSLHKGTAAIRGGVPPEAVSINPQLLNALEHEPGMMEWIREWWAKEHGQRGSDDEFGFEHDPPDDVTMFHDYAAHLGEPVPDTFRSHWAEPAYDPWDGDPPITEPDDYYWAGRRLQLPPWITRSGIDPEIASVQEGSLRDVYDWYNRMDSADLDVSDYLDPDARINRMDNNQNHVKLDTNEDGERVLHTVPPGRVPNVVDWDRIWTEIFESLPTDHSFGTSTAIARGMKILNSMGLRDDTDGQQRLEKFVNSSTDETDPHSHMFHLRKLLSASPGDDGLHGLPKAVAQPTSKARYNEDWSPVRLATQENVGQKIKALLTTDPAAEAVYNALSPYGDIYVVGGAVRDLALGKIPKDIDIMARGIDPNAIIEVLQGLPGAVKVTGNQFPVIRYALDGFECEIALPRRERSTGGGGKSDFDVDMDVNMPVEEDLLRRDFTVNAMAVDLKTGELIDPYGGWDDAEAGTLSLVNPKAFEEDGTRLLRALSSRSRHGLRPDAATIKAMQQYAHRLSGHKEDGSRYVPNEQISAELEKIMKGDDPSEAIELALHSGVLNHFLPEVANTHGFDQKNRHHSQELFDHMNSVLKHMAEINKDPDARLASLLHDIGKPSSQWIDENGNGHYYEKHHEDGSIVGKDHEDEGANMASERLREMGYGTTNRINRIEHLVRSHMFPPFDNPKGARRFLAKYGDEHADDLLDLRQADSGNKASPWDGNTTDQRALVEGVRSANQPTTLKSLAINGNDVAQALGIKPGPQIGQALNYLQEQVLENPDLNTREALLGLLVGQKFSSLTVHSWEEGYPGHDPEEYYESLKRHGLPEVPYESWALEPGHRHILSADRYDVQLHADPKARDRWEVHYRSKPQPGLKSVKMRPDDQMTTLYDPRYVDIHPHEFGGDEGRLDYTLKPAPEGSFHDRQFRPDLNNGVDLNEQLRDPGHIWRGMSAEEYREMLDKGEVRSKGLYNLGDFQKGLSYFADERYPSKAFNYAHSFAPFAHQATFDNPAYVIKARRPEWTQTPEHGHHVSDGENAVSHLPVDHIEQVYEGVPVLDRPGRFGFSHYWGRWEGAGGSPRHDPILWSPVSPPRQKQSNILDEIQDGLDIDVWEDPESAKPRIRPHIAEWVRKTIEHLLRDNGYEALLKDYSLYLTGSLTTYQWSHKSDFDVSLFTAFDRFPEFRRADLISLMVEHLDGVLVPGTTHVLQCYVIPMNVTPEMKFRPGERSAFDLKKEKWLVPPEKERARNVHASLPNLMAHAKEQADKLSLLLKHDPEAAKRFIKALHKRRLRDQTGGKGDFSQSNIIYKWLENAGLLHG